MNSYYHSIIQQLLKFVVPENQKILYYGSYGKEFLLALKPAHLVIVNAEPRQIYSSENGIKYIYSKYHQYKPDEKYDYIILDTAIGKSEDISRLLLNIAHGCTKHTRIIIHQENYLLRPLMNLASAFGLKRLEKTQNWISVRDVQTYLKSAGFEPTRTYHKTVFPLKLGFIGPLLNFIFALIPFIDFLKLDQFIVARCIHPHLFSDNSYPMEVTICITVKDEEKNIEPIVASLPILCEKQEILFVEGSSSDNTAKEIERMQAIFPHKNVRMVKEHGNEGQGNAIKIGFKEAKGEIIILYEGDGTSEPNDIKYFYDTMKSGRFEFIEGSRFVYPLSHASMPIINKIGNICFALWFSFFLNQRTTDVLSGIKAMFRKDYDKVFRTWGFIGIRDPFGDFELLFGSARYGLKIGEVPMHYRPRFYGVSKTKVFKHGWYLLKMSLGGYYIFRNSKH